MGPVQVFTTPPSDEESPVEVAVRALRQAADALEMLPAPLRPPAPVVVMTLGGSTAKLQPDYLRQAAQHIGETAHLVIEATTPISWSRRHEQPGGSQ